MNLFKRFQSFLTGNNGSTSVIIICTTMVVVLVSAIITDVGYAAIENYKLRREAEKAAKYGAERMVSNEGNVKEAVQKYIVKNVHELNQLDVKVSENSKALSVYLEKPFRYIFLQLVGFREKQIRGYCTVKVSSISGLVGVRPFVIEKQNIMYGKEFVLSSKPSVVKDNAGQLLHMIPINLGEGNYKANIVYGYRRTLSVGQGVYALKGDTLKATEEALSNIIKAEEKLMYKDDEKRIFIIPVVDKIDSSGNEAMNILGFVAFYVIQYKMYKDSITIKGMFSKKMVKGSTSDGTQDFGVMGIKIIR